MGVEHYWEGFLGDHWGGLANREPGTYILTNYDLLWHTMTFWSLPTSIFFTFFRFDGLVSHQQAKWLWADLTPLGWPSVEPRWSPFAVFCGPCLRVHGLQKWSLSWSSLVKTWRNAWWTATVLQRLAVWGRPMLSPWLLTQELQVIPGRWGSVEGCVAISFGNASDSRSLRQCWRLCGNIIRQCNFYVCL